MFLTILVLWLGLALDIMGLSAALIYTDYAVGSALIIPGVILILIGVMRQLRYLQPPRF